jgi:hypothetical protein
MSSQSTFVKVGWKSRRLKYTSKVEKEEKKKKKKDIDEWGSLVY